MQADFSTGIPTQNLYPIVFGKQLHYPSVP